MLLERILFKYLREFIDGFVNDRGIKLLLFSFLVGWWCNLTIDKFRIQFSFELSRDFLIVPEHFFIFELFFSSKSSSNHLFQELTRYTTRTIVTLTSLPALPFFLPIQIQSSQVPQVNDSWKKLKSHKLIKLTKSFLFFQEKHNINFRERS